jgi:hypothetical protein
MFKPKKKSMVEAPTGPELPKVFVDNEVPGGPGTVFLAGSSAAWAQSFKIRKPESSPAPSPSSMRRSTHQVAGMMQAAMEDDNELEDDDLLVNSNRPYMHVILVVHGAVDTRVNSDRHFVKKLK